ncbi:hypothetical protein ACROYT_G012165 [Oculina patagonica]
MFAFCILLYRNKEPATHKNWKNPSRESWRRPRQLFYTEDILDGKLNFSLAGHLLTYEQRKDKICGKDWQENYKKLHKDILQSRRRRQFIVFSCMEEGYKCAGYGNRLGGITSLLFLSILTQRAFLIEWDQTGVPLDNYLLPKEHLWKNPVLEKNALELGISNERSSYSLIGCAFDFLFQKSGELKTRLDAARRSLCLESQVPKIGLQIRMGDVSFGRGSLQNNNIDYKAFFGCAQALEEALARQRPNTFKKHLKWFLATDDNNVKEYARENYPLNVVTLNITPQHIKSLKTRDSESTEGTLGVLLDHFLLSECDFLILSRSTFGTSAAGLLFHPKGTFTYGPKGGDTPSL